MIHSHPNIAAYEPAEASRLLGVSARRIRGWLGGYRSAGEFTPPLWERQYSSYDQCYLGFRDLIEVRFVDAFVRAGLSVQAIRSLLAKAREIACSDYPFSTYQFSTDGRTMFLEVWETDQDQAKAIDVRSGQHAFHSIVRPSFRDLDFDMQSVRRWHVGGRQGRILIDPDLAFGQPVVVDTSISTARLFEAFQAEGDIRTVARYFEVPPGDVKRAVEFERKLAGLH